MTPPPTDDAASPPHRRATPWLLGLAWTLLVLLIAVLAWRGGVQTVRQQARASTATQLTAIAESLRIVFGQWSALAGSLSHRAAVVEFMAQTPMPVLAGLPPADRVLTHAEWRKRPAVQQAMQDIAAVSRDFSLPLITLSDPSGYVRIDSGALASPDPPYIGRRLYFEQALAEGSGQQFLYGQLTGVPGLYFSARIGPADLPLGVVTVKQNADVINRMLLDGSGNTALLTDANRVVVLGNRSELAMSRLPDAPDWPDERWREVYQRVPARLPWQMETLEVGDRALPAVRIGERRHLLQSAALPGTTLTAWVLAPLDAEPAIGRSVAGGAALIWLLGGTLLWFGWRRLQWLEAASGARQALDKASAAQREAEQRFAAVLAHAPAAYLFFDADGVIVDCNPAALALFGAPAAQALCGRVPWYPPLSPERQADGEDSQHQALELRRRHLRSRDRVQHCEWRFRRLDGALLDCEVAVIALDWDGQVRFCAVVQDVTARRAQQQATQEARAAAEAASRTKSSFLANMSHELRTPMNAIIGMTHLALEDGLPPKQRDYVAKAHGAARNLLQIVNDILDISKIEAGQLELERIDFDVETVVREMSDVLALKAEEKGLELLFSAEPALPRRLVGDPTRLRQVLVNLGSNAIKFTDRGAVTVGMAVQSQDEREVVLHVWVRDTGIGLSAEQVERLFVPFVQADVSTTRRYGGSGLGLVISRELVERMGGRIWVESRLGAGATFHFSARFGRSAPRAEGRGWKLGTLRGRRALLADDSGEALDVLGRMLEDFGIGVDRVASGAAALDRFESQPPGTYTWVLLDWKMPDVDGIDCARRLLARGDLAPPCVLLVTSFGLETALRAARGLALAGVLQKPVTPSGLHDTLLQALPSSTVAPPAQALPSTPMLSPAERAALAGLHVLLVEDHPLNQELAVDLLQRAGVRVTLAPDGEQALARMADAGPFDAVLMDCQMPVMDGYTATARLRENPAWRDVPVIAMTASALAGDRERALAAGMNAYVSKPLDIGLLLRTLLREAMPAGRLPPPPRPAASAPDWPAAGLGTSIDTAAGLAHCAGKPALYRKLLQGFRDDAARYGPALQQALDEGRLDDARRAAHDLHGLAGTLGATALAASAGALLAALRAGEARPSIDRLLADRDEVLRDIGLLLAQ